VKRHFISAVYVLNIVIQAIVTLLLNVGIMLFIAWCAVAKLGAPDWLYVPLILIGVFWGLYMMIRFIIVSGEGLERLEKQSKKK
jgi:hypothetical protein